MSYEVAPVAEKARHWLVNGQELAGPVDEAGAIALYQDAFENPNPTPPPISRAAVNEERKRRIANNQTITLSDGRTFTVQTRNEEDFRNLNGLVTQAVVYSMSQQLSVEMTLRDADNVDQILTPAQMIETGSKVAAQVERLYEKSWEIKQMSPIPDDYKSDGYWI